MKIESLSLPPFSISAERQVRTEDERNIVGRSMTEKRTAIGPTAEEVRWGIGFSVLLRRVRKTRDIIPEDTTDKLVDHFVVNIPAKAYIGALAYEMTIDVGNTFSVTRWHERRNGPHPDEVAYYRTRWSSESEKHEPVDFKEMVRVRKDRRSFYKSLRYSRHFYELARAVVASDDPNIKAVQDKFIYLRAVAEWLESANQLWLGGLGDSRELMNNLRQYRMDRIKQGEFLVNLLEGADENTKQVILQRVADTRDGKWHLNERLTTIFPPALAGTRGDAKKRGTEGHQAATRGLLVKMLDRLLPEYNGQRFGIIAGLLGFVGVVGLSPQNVRSILSANHTPRRVANKLLASWPRAGE